jgi:Flp pilus assembly protein protease CpaA
VVNRAHLHSNTQQTKFTFSADFISPLLSELTLTLFEFARDGLGGGDVGLLADRLELAVETSHCCRQLVSLLSRDKKKSRLKKIKLE